MIIRTILVGILFIVCTSVSFAAAVPEFGCDSKAYLTKLTWSSGGGIGNPTFIVKTPSSYCGDLDAALVAVANDYVGAPNSSQFVFAGGCSAPLVPEGGSVNIVLNSGTMNSFIVDHLCVPDAPTEAGTVSDYNVQDILVIGFAFLAMCFGWGVGARVA